MMKKLLSSVGLLMGLGAVLAPLPAQAQYWNTYDTGIWGSDNWGTDTYGYYDQDFAWETDRGVWDSWYGDSENYWTTYDDIGDEGWFDL